MEEIVITPEWLAEHKCTKMTVKGKMGDYMPIAELAKFVKRSITGIRYLIEVGNRYNKLKATRVGAHYFVLVQDIFEFEVVKPGGSSTIKYRWDINGDLYFSPTNSRG